MSTIESPARQGCTGFWTEGPDGREFDCDFEDGRICEDCPFGPFQDEDVNKAISELFDF
jgi:hypothetical protein